MSAGAWAWVGIAVATAIFTSGLAVQPAEAFDLKTLSSADIRALQERLRDAKCYTGAIDGVAIRSGRRS